MDNQVEYRVCSRCCINKPLTNEFFYHQYKGTNKYQWICRECYRKRDRERYEKDKEYIKNKSNIYYHRKKLLKKQKENDINKNHPI